MPRRRRRDAKKNTKKKNRQGDPKSKSKSITKPSLSSKNRYRLPQECYNNQSKIETGAPQEKKGRPELYKKPLWAPPPCRGPAPLHRRGRPSPRGEGQQQKVKQVRSTRTHMHDIEHTCHGRCMRAHMSHEHTSRRIRPPRHR